MSVSFLRLCRAVVMLALGVFASILPGCQCSASSEGADAGTGALSELAPVEVPASVVARIYVPKPGEVWQKLRVAVGGAAFFMPRGLGSMCVLALGLPLGAGGEIDELVPALGAVGVDAEGTPMVVLGIHVKAGNRMVTMLSEGTAARFSASPHEESKIVLLTPLDAKPVGSVAPSASASAGGPNEPPSKNAPGLELGVLGHYLLLGSSRAALLELGPYVARNLPKESAKPAEGTSPSDVRVDFVDDVFRTRLGPHVNTILSMLEALPVPSELGPSKAIGLAALREGADALGGVGRANATLNIDEHAARVTLQARASDQSTSAQKQAWKSAIDSLPPGDPSPLLALPAGTLALGFVSSTASGREAQANSTAALLQSLVGTSNVDLQTPFAEVARARGDWFVAGVGFSEFGLMAYARSAVKDEQALPKALSTLFELARDPAVKSKLDAADVRISTGSTRVERLVGEVERVRIGRVGGSSTDPSPPASPKPGETKPAGPPTGLPDQIDLLYMLKDSQLLMAAGWESKEALRALVDAADDRALSADPSWAVAIEHLQKEAGLAVGLDWAGVVARRYGRRELPKPAPILVSAGAKDGLWLRLDISRPAIVELVRGERL